MSEIKKFVLTAGGTGGHVFPAEALAKELTEEGYAVCFVTDKRGNSFSGKFPTAKEYRVFATGYAGKSFFEKLKGLFFLGLGVLQSLVILRKEKPAAVIGFGGYAAFPAAFAAELLGIPVILHEQNAVLGGANRFLAKKSALIATTFPNVARVPEGKKTVFTGVPLRPEILALCNQPYPEPKEPFCLLITGGSQGAKLFSDVIPSGLKLLPAELKSKLKIAQQCRPDELDAVNKAYEDSGLCVETAPFFTDMPTRLKSAHLLICRGGASSLQEAAAAGRPAVIVPIYRSADAHQLANAKSLAETGGAFIMEEPDFTPERLADKIQELFNDPKTLITASEQIRQRAKPDAAKQLAAAVIDITKNG